MARVEILCTECGEPVPFEEEQPGGPMWHRACEPAWIKRLREENELQRATQIDAMAAIVEGHDALIDARRERDEAVRLLANIHENLQGPMSLTVAEHKIEVTRELTEPYAKKHQP